MINPMATLAEIETMAFKLPESDRAKLAADLLDSLPGVLVEDDEKRREEQAARMGFSAYAVTRGAADDPVGVALNRLIDHVAEQDRRIEALQEQLRRVTGAPGTGHEAAKAGQLDPIAD